MRCFACEILSSSVFIGRSMQRRCCLWRRCQRQLRHRSCSLRRCFEPPLHFGLRQRCSHQSPVTHSPDQRSRPSPRPSARSSSQVRHTQRDSAVVRNRRDSVPLRSRPGSASEEHTSELQSRPHLVCRLLLEKKKTNHFPTFLLKQKKNTKNQHDN